MSVTRSQGEIRLAGCAVHGQLVLELDFLHKEKLKLMAASCSVVRGGAIKNDVALMRQELVSGVRRYGGAG